MSGDLLDVNVLLALAWPNHQFHAPARRWFLERSGPWLTCTVTQLGFVRLSSNPAFTRHAKTPLEASLLLSSMVRHAMHRYLPDADGLLGETFGRVVPRLQGHQQVTDAYLLALASAHGARLATFERRLEIVSPFEGTVEVLQA